VNVVGKRAEGIRNCHPAALRVTFFLLLHAVPCRSEILRILIKRCPVDASMDLLSLARELDGYSGADLAALVHEAGVAALEESLQAACVRVEHFNTARHLVQPSGHSSPALHAMYSSFSRLVG
jgi:SpoVK/Ycf46/Vps4 family AAA+-type ATPase